MSRIESVNVNYQPSTNLSRAKTKNSAKNQSFGNKIAEAEKIVERTVGDKLYTQSGWLGKISRYLGLNDSEVQTQALNAIFTATLAPMFIAWNPFSKQDEKTKKYTALRQPISAGIAISGGVAMTMGVNALTAKMGSEGFIKSLDLRTKADLNDYLKYDFDKAYKNATDKRAFLKSYEPKDFDERIRNFTSSNPDASPTKEYRKACMEGYAEKINKARTELFNKLTHMEPEHIKIDPNTTVISALEDDKWVEIGKDIPNLKNKQQFDDYITENNIHKVTINKQLTDAYARGTKIENASGVDALEKIGVKLSEEDKIKLMGSDAKGMNFGKVLEHFGLKKDMKVKEALDIIAGKLIEKDIKADFIEFSKNILTNKADRMAKDFGNFKKYFGIGTNLFTTAITCTVLNWAYPRIVNNLFPSLNKTDPAKDQVKKGGNK